MTAQRIDHGVTLTGRDLAEAAYVISLGLRTMAQRDGVTPTESMWRLGHLLRTTAEAARASRSGNPQFPGTRFGAGLDLAELMTTEEASEMLSVSQRQVRNLAPRLAVRRVGRLLMFDRAAVVAEVARRREDLAS